MKGSCIFLFIQLQTLETPGHLSPAFLDPVKKLLVISLVVLPWSLSTKKSYTVLTNHVKYIKKSFYFLFFLYFALHKYYLKGDENEIKENQNSSFIFSMKGL